MNELPLRRLSGDLSRVCVPMTARAWRRFMTPTAQSHTRCRYVSFEVQETQKTSSRSPSWRSGVKRGDLMHLAEYEAIYLRSFTTRRSISFGVGVADPSWPLTQMPRWLRPPLVQKRWWRRCQSEIESALH